jgi:hypothetical protein
LPEEKAGERNLLRKTDIKFNNAIQKFYIRKCGPAFFQVKAFITFVKFHHLPLGIYLPPLVAEWNNVLAIASC